MAKADRVHVIGLISDTHGVLRPGVHDALKGSSSSCTPAMWAGTRFSMSSR